MTNQCIQSTWQMTETPSYLHYSQMNTCSSWQFLTSHHRKWCTFYPKCALWHYIHFHFCGYTHLYFQTQFIHYMLNTQTGLNSPSKRISTVLYPDAPIKYQISYAILNINCEYLLELETLYYAAKFWLCWNNHWLKVKGTYTLATKKG